ncbi:hypothetical protein BD626DRAFT_488840 [Schizophyllum amplum]|uniref:GDP-fucose protein O-fucosyltransferase-domain-containing protein n=1 Tax=Schizophyllum amplum TaxID=97359 RepID=A0A550CKW9_9AGAR|nr:hypothetical protein BD626DRAFT_488840 [Auriculariopsis ampla]
MVAFSYKLRSPDLSILPTKTPSSPVDWRPRNSHMLTKRYCRVIVAVLVCGGVLAFLSGQDYLDRTSLEAQLAELSEGDQITHVPLYPKFHEYERRLPQHNPTLPAPEGEHAKFLFIANHAYRDIRFENYTWERTEEDYAYFNGKKIPARVPLSALISGPMVGGSLGSDSHHIPRAVSREYFYKACSEVKIIRSDEVKDTFHGREPSAKELMDAWVAKIDSMEDRCIEIEKNSMQLFDIWLLGTERVLDIWPELSVSPAVKHFGMSPLILAAFNANKAHFAPKASYLDALIPTLPFSGLFDDSSAPASQLDGLMALHIRRGDFEGHCDHLARWGSVYNGFNSFQTFPDHFQQPGGCGWGESTPECHAEYLLHCFPTVEQITQKVLDVREELKERGIGGKLNRVFVMSNGANEWLQELKQGLAEAGRQHGLAFESISTSRDLVLTPEQKYVAQQLDMYVGQRAQVFIGNGFSSLTSNVAMLRMANGFDTHTTRFW